ncbi:hypothetical protein [Subtercola endophyticus]|uniref:hypothetical protein n=1 Tax=Subtercola endophyticus TaxID=2895559 RepID=UPI001E3FF43B|nr:hypothetical protein [Subtercola endophyticus]UFS58285.1 hypothetical protein LQ955_14875 [Subtercola endophyticus]
MGDNTLDNVMVSLSDTREIRLSKLLSAWSQHVERLRNEVMTSNSDSSWTPHDLVAALILRDRVSDALNEFPLLSDAANAAGLTAADRVFKAITIEDPDELVVSFASKQRPAQWWWSRLPKSGSIRDDLVAFGRNFT